MKGRVHYVNAPVTAPQRVSNLSEGGFVHLRCSTGKAVHAAHFLHRCRGDGKNLTARPEQNELFGPQGMSSARLFEAHQRTPTGRALLRLSTRFSMAG